LSHISPWQDSAKNWTLTPSDFLDILWFGMIFSRSNSRTCLALMAWGVSGGVALHAMAQDGAASAKPGESGAATNAQSVANSTRAKKDGLKRLEKDLSRSFHSFSFQDSMDGLNEPAPQAPVVIMQNPRAREFLERKKNWMSMDPEDVLPPGWSPSSGDDPFGLYNSKRNTTEKKSTLEQFYDNLDRPRAKGNKSSFLDDEESDKTGRKKISRTGPDQEDDSNLPSGVRERERELKKLLGVDKGVNPFTAAPARNPFSDFFGNANDSGPSKAELQAHKAYLQKYQDLLSGPAPVNNGFNPQSGPEQGPRPPGYGGISTLNTLGTSRPEQALGVITPPTIPVAQPDINARVLNAWNPFYTLPKVEETKSAPLKTPVTEAPRRKF
jgi:hypothetical protein